MVCKQVFSYPLFRIKNTNKLFCTIHEAAKEVGKLTVDKNYKHPAAFEKGFYRKKVKGLVFCKSSLFKEIEMVLNLDKETTSFIKNVPEKKSIPLNNLVKKVVNELMLFIEGIWDRSKIHVVIHSSGYDSRLISAIIRKLEEKNGSSWLGEVYFICYEPEVQYFRMIMEYEGWEEKNLRTVKEKYPPLDYYKEAVSFENVGKYCSDVYNNRFGSYCYTFLIRKELEKFGVSNKSIQLFSGLYVDELFKQTQDFVYFVVKKMYDPQFELGMYDIVLPFLSFGVVSVLRKHILYPLRKGAKDKVKIEMVKFLDSKLATFPNYRIAKGGYGSFDKLSEHTRKVLEKEFRKSWYFKEVNPESVFPFPDTVISKSRSFREYSKAAICEYLINGSGCSLRV